jgi:hypothetical protein
MMEVLLLPTAPYTDSRQRLLASHELTAIQQVEQFTNMLQYVAQQPSNELAVMI